MLLTNTALGVLGIGLAQLQRGRSRFYYWSMIGSGVLLLLPILQYVFSRFALMTHNYKLHAGYQVVTLMPTIQLVVW
jgi:hypothetical protein